MTNIKWEKSGTAPVTPTVIKSDGASVTAKGNEMPFIALKAERAPSRFLVYPHGTWIRYRPFTFGEVKVLNQDNLDARKRQEILMRGIESNMSLYDLGAMDYQWILLLRRMSSEPPDAVWSKNVICPSCGREQGIYFKPTDLEFEDLKTTDFRVTLGGREMTFDIYRIKDALAFDDLEANRSDEQKALDPNGEYVILASVVRNMAFAEAYDWLLNKLWQEEDAHKLNEVQKLLNYGPHSLKRKCKFAMSENADERCEADFLVPIHLGVGSIYPFRNDRRS
jgi:hypothetical protein